VAEILAVCISEETGVQKHAVAEIAIRPGHGLEGDAHARDWHRQVSLLAEESIDKMRAKGLELASGAFGENLVTRGLDLTDLPIGTQLKVGGEILLEVTQIGKVCHDRCAIYYAAGECIMPTEGIFCRVLEGGTVRPGDPIDVVSRGPVGSE
jgi:MOSC domain-containing protein YiiM